MFLARVRVDDDAVVLAARLTSGRLLRLDHVPDVASDDPVTVLRTLGASALRDIIGDLSGSRDRLMDVGDVEFEPPVAHPQKIICLALNYAAHAAEGDQNLPEEPIIFFKPTSSLVGHRQTVRCPARSCRLEYEVELAVVIGEHARDVPAAQWGDVVLGYTILNDVTARDMQLRSIERNQPWDHSKAFDTFAPCGPYLVTADEVTDPMALDLSLRVAGKVMQSGNTREMVFGIPKLIEAISAGISLLPGDIIATGTPSGIGRVAHGETMAAHIEGLGTLLSPVAYEGSSAVYRTPGGGPAASPDVGEPAVRVAASTHVGAAE